MNIDIHNDIILHHSSKSGIVGDIAPISRPHCDFGKGFYMGTDEKQTQALTMPDKYTNPIYYRILFKLSEIDPQNILVLSDMDWVYFVLYNRGQLESLKNTGFYERYKNIANDKDVIIGPIADDNMRGALLDFQDGYITDVALKKCLETVDYGLQYVIKTEEACEKAVIIEQLEIKKSIDLKKLADYSTQRKIEGNNAYKLARFTSRKEGHYLDEIIAMENQKAYSNNKENDTI